MEKKIMTINLKTKESLNGTGNLESLRIIDGKIEIYQSENE